VSAILKAGVLSSVRNRDGSDDRCMVRLGKHLCHAARRFRGQDIAAREADAFFDRFVGSARP
jgi:hypothetical protein